MLLRENLQIRLVSCTPLIWHPFFAWSVLAVGISHPCTSLDSTYLALAKGQQQSCWGRTKQPKGINWTNPSLCSDDIFEHLPALRALAAEPDVDDVLECGVAYGSSTAAFLSARPRRIYSVDLVKQKTIAPLEQLAAACGATDFKFLQQGSLAVKLHGHGALPVPDLLFLDTLHTGAQLSQELSLLGPSTRRYIVMHDTTLFAFEDENVAYYPYIQSVQGTPPPRSDRVGLWPAVLDFLVRQPDWFLALRCFNNNGLTILRRSEGGSKDAEVSEKLRRMIRCHTDLNNSLASSSPLLYDLRSRLSLANGLMFESFLRRTLKLARVYLQSGVPGALAPHLWRDLVRCCMILSERSKKGRPSSGEDMECEPSELDLLHAELRSQNSYLPPLRHLLDEFGT